MRILELCDFFSNYPSNFIPSLEYLEKALAKNGHQVFFIFSKRNLSKKFFEWEIPFSKKHQTELFDFSKRSIINEVVAFINNNKIDIVHGHFLASFYFSEIKRKSPKNVLFFEHIHSIPYNGNKTFRCRIKHFRNIFLLNHKIPKICISNAMVPMTRYVYPYTPIYVCRNAIDFNRLTCDSHFDAKKSTILLFGYNYYVKGVDVAIDAVDILNRTRDIHLDIVFSDNFDKNKDIITKKYGKIPTFISLLEPVNNVIKLYKEHEIFLNASRSEGMSYAIVEAYYSGCKCVISDIGANKEINLPNIITFQNENPNDLASKLSEALDKTTLNDFDQAKNNFGLDAWAQSLINVFFGN